MATGAALHGPVQNAAGAGSTVAQTAGPWLDLPPTISNINDAASQPMKFISMPNILRANKLFSKLCAADPQSSIEMEVYSCKQTRLQRMHHDVPKPLRFYISALEEAFGDYDFSRESGKSFQQTTYDAIRSEVSFMLFKMQRNYDDVEETVGLFDAVLGQCVSLRASVFYTATQLFGDEAERRKVFLIHDRKLKRVVVIKLAA